MRRGALVLVVLAAAAGAAAPGAGATSECRGIQACIPVAGPWVAVQAGRRSHWLLACPRGQGVVGGLDALATSSAVRVEFAGRLGAPVAPGTTTTRSAFFAGTLAGKGTGAFQPRIGCIPTGGGGGRSTLSARAVPPGAPLERVAKTIRVAPGRLAFGSVTCPAGTRRTGGWTAVAFRGAKPPAAGLARLVDVRTVAQGARVSATVSSSDALSVGARAIVQVGVECAP